LQKHTTSPFPAIIGDNGEIKLAGLTKSVSVIAIDKHGNESNPFIINNPG